MFSNKWKTTVRVEYGADHIGCMYDSSPYDTCHVFDFNFRPTDFHEIGLLNKKDPSSRVACD